MYSSILYYIYVVYYIYNPTRHSSYLIFDLVRGVGGVVERLNLEAVLGQEGLHVLADRLVIVDNEHAVRRKLLGHRGRRSEEHKNGVQSTCNIDLCHLLVNNRSFLYHL